VSGEIGGQSAAGGIGAHSFLDVKRMVTTPVGGREDAYLLGLAEEEINLAIDELNLWDRFSFFRKQAVDAAFSLGQTEIAFPEAAHRIHALQAVSVSTGLVVHTLEWIDWNLLLHRHTKEPSSGTPSYFGIMNAFDDRQVRFWRAADQETVDDLQSRLTYYEAIPNIEGDETVLQAPRRIALCVVMGARLNLMQAVRPNQVAVWGNFRRRWEQLKMLVSVDETDRDPDPFMYWGPEGNVSPLDGLSEEWRMPWPA
jgi:hypothetical protein